MLSSPRVVASAKEYYGCSHVEGIELEDFGGEGTAGSHWEYRQAGNEYMTGWVNPQMPISILTLSLFEDMGWYKVNYQAQEFFGWGKGEGCEWLTGRCETGWVGKHGFFCQESDTVGCSPDRKGKAVCDFSREDSVLPAYYQHFSDPTVGSFNPAPDYCTSYASTVFCQDENVPANDLVGEVFGSQSFCFEYSTDIIQDMACWPVTCSSNGRASLNINGVSVECPRAGGTVETDALPQGGTIHCPSAAFLCKTVSGPSG
jgi:leishmanolysin